MIDAAAAGQLAALNGTGTGRGYADLAFTDAAGKPQDHRRFRRQDAAGQLLGQLVRALPRRNAGAAGPRRPNTIPTPSRSCRSISTSATAASTRRKAFLADEKLTCRSIPHRFEAFQRLQRQAVTVGLPTTLLLDEKGCELAVLQGPAEWNSPDGRAVIDALLGT